MTTRRRSTLATALPSPVGVLLSDGLRTAVSPFGLPSLLSGQREGLGFQFHENAADAPDGPVEFGGLRHLEIGEHPRRPRLEMALEESLLFAEVGLELAARQARHHL